MRLRATFRRTRLALTTTRSSVRPTVTAATAPMARRTTLGGPFLVPIGVQSNPTANPHVHDNTYDGKPTNPPYS